MKDMQMFGISIVTTSKYVSKPSFPLSMLENGEMHSCVCSKCFVNILGGGGVGGTKWAKIEVFQQL